MDKVKYCGDCSNYDKEHLVVNGNAGCLITKIKTNCNNCAESCPFYNVDMERIKVLPCKIGDMVYVLTHDSPTGIEETKAYKISLSKNSYRVCCRCVYDDWSNARWEFLPYEFGIKVFLTPEAAKKALKEREDNAKN